MRSALQSADLSRRHPPIVVVVIVPMVTSIPVIDIHLLTRRNLIMIPPLVVTIVVFALVRPPIIVIAVGFITIMMAFVMIVVSAASPGRWIRPGRPCPQASPETGEG